MAYNITDDNVWLDAQGERVLEVEGGSSLGHNGPKHFFAADGSTTSGNGGEPLAPRTVFLDIEGMQLNTLTDRWTEPDGTIAITSVSWDNSSLPTWPQAIALYNLQLVFNESRFKYPPKVTAPTVLRHSNTYSLTQSDNHGNVATFHVADGRIDTASFVYGDAHTAVVDRFDAKGNLVDHQVGGQSLDFTEWLPRANGSWTKTVEDSTGHVTTTTLAAADAIQQVANDAATRWSSSTTVVSPSNGNLVLNEGDLLLNKDFQYVVGTGGTSLIGQDAAGLIGHDGGSLIGHDGGSLIGQDGAGIIALQLNSLIGHDGGSLIGHDGGSLLGQDGASLIRSTALLGDHGSELIGHDGGSFVSSLAAALNTSGHTVGTRLVDALVFADANFNGQLDDGESWTTTDSDGGYSLPGATGPLVVIGGTDAATGLPFKGTMEATPGSSIISPLTTLTTELWKQVGSLEDTLDKVNQAFGLSSVDFTDLDPIAGIENGDATSAQVYVDGVKVFDTVDLMTSTLQGMGADKDAAENAVVQAMVGDLLQGGPLNLDDSHTVSALFTTAATGVGLDGTAAADGVTKIVLSTNAQLDSALAGNSVGQGLLDALTPVETNVQGSLSSGLVAAAGDPNKIADVASGGGSTPPDTTPPDQTPPVHSGPPHWMASVDITAHPAGWSPSGIGDFNHDGTADLAWFNSTSGDLDTWELANGQWSASSDVGPHPAGYQPVGFGDYNHDGTSDVLWFNPTTRDVDLWEMSNGKWAGSVSLGAHPAGYTPTGTGDFNGDGTSDVLWYNPTTRDVDIWQMSNGHWAASSSLGSHPAGYQPAVVGDFNGDHTSDVAWFNPTTGDVDIWMIQNGKWAGSVSVGSHPAGYKPIGAADLNHDGTSDIVWYNPATNDVDVWLLNNKGQWSASLSLGAHPAGAVPVGIGDFDHNGVSDLMWQDTHTGHIDNWMLQIG